MKTRFTALFALTLSCASLAQTDPVAEQISLTRDAVRLAVQELENGPTQPADTADVRAKVAAFNREATAALSAFEANVRTRILTPLQVLVTNYNALYRSAGPQAPALRSLGNQITSLVDQLGDAYREETIRLYRPLRNIPAVVRTQPFVSEEINVTERLNGYFSGTVTPAGRHCEYSFDSIVLGGGRPYCSNKFRAEAAVFLVSGSGAEERIVLKRFGENSERGLNDLIHPTMRPSISNGFFNQVTAESHLLFERDFGRETTTPTALLNFLTAPANPLTHALLDGCFSSTCFYQTIATASLWDQLVQSRLARDLAIRTADGNVFTISAGRKYREGTPDRYVIAGQLLGHATSGQLVSDLPGEVSADRLAVLARIDAAVTGTPFNRRNCQRAVRAAKAELARLPEGPISAAETALFTYRANGIGSGRAACLN